MIVVPAPQTTSLAPGLTNQYPSPFLPFRSSGAQLGTFPAQNTAGGATSATTFAAPAQTQAPTPAATQAQSTPIQLTSQTPTQAPPAPAPAPTFPAPPAPMSQSQNRTPQLPRA
ncbi:hypothetical protein FA13DRAFT_1789519 [Coprinellus micaceus]|uniref:Uncharacterized protein n=1 Tax=Coprinellus micaceus TaxID=71717 RepID=A0A4Y7TJR3_COPMI|nr:hypothetical protein FA13DRAFT_1789519 [Coprinellus micaceus]